jgi:hypothetical protein
VRALRGAAELQVKAALVALQTEGEITPNPGRCAMTGWRRTESGCPIARIRFITVTEGVAWIDEKVAMPPRPNLNSCDADGDRASQLQHPVQDKKGDANFGRPTDTPARLQPVVNHLLVAPDDLRDIIHFTRRQFSRDDFVRLCIHPGMQLLPGTACPGAVLFDQPLVGAAEFQSRAVHQQMHRLGAPASVALPGCPLGATAWYRPAPGDQGPAGE